MARFWNCGLSPRTSKTACLGPPTTRPTAVGRGCRTTPVSGRWTVHRTSQPTCWSGGSACPPTWSTYASSSACWWARTRSYPCLRATASWPTPRPTGWSSTRPTKSWTFWSATATRCTAMAGTHHPQPPAPPPCAPSPGGTTCGSLTMPPTPCTARSTPGPPTSCWTTTTTSRKPSAKPPQAARWWQPVGSRKWTCLCAG